MHLGRQRTSLQSETGKLTVTEAHSPLPIVPQTLPLRPKNYWFEAVLFMGLTFVALSVPGRC